jgi:Ca-activated chloride channel homolog
MSTWTERKITRDLSERDSIEPPEGLLEKLKADIPADLGSRLPAAAHREAEVVAMPDRPMPRRQRWLLAASLILTVAGGLLAAMVVMSPREEAEMEVEESVAAAPQTPAAVAPEIQQDASAASEPEAAPPAESAPETLASVDGEERKLESLGYASEPAPPPPPPPAPELKELARRERQAAAAPAAPESSRFEDRIDVTTEAPLVDQRRISTGVTAPAKAASVQPVEVMEADAEGGVESGVSGGIPGGVVGGAVGGVAGAPSGARADAPQRFGSRVELNESVPSQDMMFKSVGAHPFVETARDRLSTFGLDVDTASYTMARRYLREGRLPPREAIRVEEFVNYFSYGDPPPARGDFALRAEGAASIFTREPRTYLLRFNLRAREVKAEHRKPAVLTFVVDVSGSMDQGNRLGLVKQSLGLLLDQLRKDDQVGLVVYGDAARVLLEPTSDRELIRQAVQRLVPTGATNAEAGIILGYDVAGRSFRPGAINRLLLCSDGVANVGATGPAAILARIQREAKRGIELTTLGFGMGNYNDVLMEQLADKGNGRYAYLDDLGEARRVLVEELTGTLQTIAEDAKAQVEFSPAAVTRWRLIGYENRDIPDEKFRDNTVDAGEIGAGHSVTALYEVQLTPKASGKIASLHLRYRVPVTGQLQETIRDLRTSDLVADWKDASPGFRLASLVVEFAETLRGSSHAEDHRKILRRLQRVAGEMEKQPRAADVAEFARLVEEAARIKAAAEKE